MTRAAIRFSRTVILKKKISSLVNPFWYKGDPMKQCMDADNLHRRFKKIIGQVQAIDRMVDEDIPCEDILAQP